GVGGAGAPVRIARRAGGCHGAPAALRGGFLAAGAAGPPGAAAAGRAGADRTSPDRGRPLPPRAGRPDGRHRLAIPETLRAAAPWQALRAPAEPGRLAIRSEDLRLRRHKRPAGTATIFVVDASGSAAMARLAEAKGAVELLLAEAYVRRDEVALVAFRGTGAEVLLPPTRAPARAKAALAALPGGGGTPLAAGLSLGLALAGRVAGRGLSPALLVLTDGRANIGRTGQPGRAEALADAETAARAIRAAGVPTLLVDTGARPSPQARRVAEEMGARYLALPRAEGRALGTAARRLTEGV
ncbi:MAG: VWA domain-containing protein, partial [Paracoccaceae bacterium]